LARISHPKALIDALKAGFDWRYMQTHCSPKRDNSVQKCDRWTVVGDRGHGGRGERWAVDGDREYGGRGCDTSGLARWVLLGLDHAFQEFA
jgi:hypothetical protein